MGVRIHPTAMIESNVRIGDGSSVWDNAHIRHDSVLGEQCIVGGKSLIAYDVRIGNRCKINSNAYICNGVTLEDGVMISAGVIFTNDRFPRATTPDLKELRSSDPDEHTLQTFVREGATIGAGAIVGCNLEIGRFAMVGMGSIVTRSVPDFCLAIGSPARVIGVVCRCGEPVHRFSSDPESDNTETTCSCGRRYSINGTIIRETNQAEPSGCTAGYSPAVVNHG